VEGHGHERVGPAYGEEAGAQPLRTQHLRPRREHDHRRLTLQHLQRVIAAHRPSTLVGDPPDEVDQRLQRVVDDELHPRGRVLGDLLGGGGPGDRPALGEHRQRHGGHRQQRATARLATSAGTLQVVDQGADHPRGRRGGDRREPERTIRIGLAWRV
jgi:hypothetical protein